jgi:hypothetical protein
MTHQYTAWHAIIRLLDDIALIIRTMRPGGAGQPRHENLESPSMPGSGAGSEFPISSSERQIGGNHAADTCCAAANDNCGHSFHRDRAADLNVRIEANTTQKARELMPENSLGLLEQNRNRQIRK